MHGNYAQPGRLAVFLYISHMLLPLHPHTHLVEEDLMTAGSMGGGVGGAGGISTSGGLPARLAALQLCCDDFNVFA